MECIEIHVLRNNSLSKLSYLILVVDLHRLFFISSLSFLLALILSQLLWLIILVFFHLLLILISICISLPFNLGSVVHLKEVLIIDFGLVNLLWLLWLRSNLIYLVGLILQQHILKLAALKKCVHHLHLLICELVLLVSYLIKSFSLRIDLILCSLMFFCNRSSRSNYLFLWLCLFSNRLLFGSSNFLLLPLWFQSKPS